MPVRQTFRGLVLQRRRSEQLPAMALQYLRQLALIHRSNFRPVRCCSSINPPPCPECRETARARFRAGALPGMRHAARHECAGAGAADRDLIADLESDLAAQDIGRLVAVVM